MIKTIIKETFFMILIGIVILLLLSVILYDDIPFNKVTPNKVSYSAPENLQEQLNETISEEEAQEVLVTYTITERDLETDEARNYYNPGKVNPFAAISTGNTNTNTNKDDENNSNNNNNNSNKQDNNDEQVGSTSKGEIYDNGTQK